ncbi:hypothetical protein L195_g025605 [Trifolium pratense]|uniref:Uncharacterized protein n=1 Tax=Trifolium pratense TaxID=57577 RepID=A0A2K3NGZ4_TRIPR|nr:hypothetical protein L195_g025605 [Trifolium pratense]
MEGKVVGNEGKLGSEVAAGNGGMLRDGSVGILVVGKLGSGGIVSLGRDGIVVGNGGRFPCGNVGIEGNGGNVVGFGKVGILGKFGCVVVCKRCLASRLMLMLDMVTTKSRVVMKDLLEAIDSLMNCRN